MKFEVSIEPMAALLARASGRPVRLVLSREEEMRTALFRENADIWIRSAVTRDGEIVGREAVVLMDCGAYGGEQTFLTTMTAHTLGANYRLGSVRLVSRTEYTNTAPTGAFRACNGTYNTFALERHTDEICAAIGMDLTPSAAGPSSAPRARCSTATSSGRCSTACATCARRVPHPHGPGQANCTGAPRSSGPGSSMGPRGAKGAGEVPILNVAAAVACAVADATGGPMNRIPLTPPTVCALADGIDKVELAHITPDWRANVLTPADFLEVTAGIVRGD
ncbi:hypothetical protein GCM10010306_098820 [Streptomyces umbrinus]|nr:hypothetical protein GCM10010306_098820 [Streptomyces umbrinus]